METETLTSLPRMIEKCHVWITVILSVLHISLACILSRDSGRAGKLSIAYHDDSYRACSVGSAFSAAATK